MQQEAIVKNNNDKYNDSISKLFSFVLCFPLLTNFFGSIANYSGISTSYSTYLIYGIYLLYSTGIYINLGKKNRLGNIVVYESLIIITLLMNFSIFKQSQVYFQDNAITLLFELVIYIPLAIQMIYISDWDWFLFRAKKIAIITPMFSLLSFFVFKVSTLISYMEFSNMILPGLFLSWLYYRKGKKISWLFVSIVDFTLICAYGGRMSLLSAVIYIIILEFVLNRDARMSTRRVVFFLILAILSVFLYFCFDDIIGCIYLNTSATQNSYIMSNILNRTFFESKTRDSIYEAAFKELGDMGLHINGLFGDRIVLDSYGFSAGHTTNYVHNIFLEILLSFGWILGGAFIIWLCMKLGMRLIKKTRESTTVVILFMFCLVFLRLLVSSSFLIDGRFLLLVALLVNPYFDKCSSVDASYGGGR